MGKKPFSSQCPPFQGSFVILSSLNANVSVFSPVSKEKTVLCPENSLLSHLPGTQVALPDGILVVFPRQAAVLTIGPPNVLISVSAHSPGVSMDLFCQRDKLNSCLYVSDSSPGHLLVHCKAANSLDSCISYLCGAKAKTNSNKLNF